MNSIAVPSRDITSEIDELVSEYGNSIYRMCFLYLKDLHLAEDAVQETFIKVYTCYPQFRGDSDIKTWIMRIAINVCKNYQRSSWWKMGNAAKSLNEAALTVDPVSLEDDGLVLEIMKLPIKYKEVILLFYYQDLPIREIAKVLDIAESTVSVRLKRGRDKLKTKIKGWYFDE